MKITNLTTGQAYQLTPGTQLEIERPNLFFNDYGEQSYPVDLPDTDLNRALCGYPDMPSNTKKPLTDIPAAISEGDYYMPCRQAVLGAKRKEKITTSFYMNEGSFLSRMQQVPLVDVFGDETVPGVTTVEEGIEWCRSLMDDSDPHFSIFPVIVELDGQRRAVNAILLMDEEGNPYVRDRNDPIGQKPEGYENGFWNSFPRRETVDSRLIQLTPGYYMTPFIRGNYLLERVFAYFGYTLEDSFFTETKPFNKMVLVNNTADALVNGTILLSHLVPDCYCNTLIDVYRKKFCCEFIPDESAKTVRVEFFKDILSAAPSDDLTDCLVGHPEINFQEPRQLKLSSDKSLSEGESFEGGGELKKKYPTAYYSASYRGIIREGYTNKVNFELLSDGNIPYYAGDADKEDYEVSVPDCQFTWDSQASLGKDQTYSLECPYIGEGRMLNSVLEGNFDDENTDDDISDFIESEHEQDPILCFTSQGTYTTGSNTMNNYSLLYNGPDGIYERFWRDFDNLLRNSFHQVTASLLVSGEKKRTLPAHAKVTLDGSEYLIDIFRYTLGGKDAPSDSDLRTLLMQEPVSLSPSHSEIFERPRYVWEVKVKSNEALTNEEWTSLGYPLEQEITAPAIYPLPPTEEQYNAGGEYYTRTIYYSFQREMYGYTVWRYLKSEISLKPLRVG